MHPEEKESELKATLSADDFLTSPLNNVLFTLPAPWIGDEGGEMAALLAPALEPLSLSYAWSRPKTGSGQEEYWTIQWLMDFNPSVEALEHQLHDYAKNHNLPDFSACRITVQAVEDVNWLEKCYQAFAPFHIGPFLIYGSHSVSDITINENDLPLLIDAATAFGTGDHGTTRGCMEMLVYLKDQKFTPQTVLDMGTGSGILAIAAHRLWDCYSGAIDNDPESVRVAALHRDKNAIAPERMICALGDGYKADYVQDKKTFDLVIANILARPLIDMAADCANACKAGGYIILSGLLETQADDVLAAHVTQGLQFVHRINHDDWTALLLKR